MNVDAVAGTSPAGTPGLREVARGFESLFLTLLMKSMRRTVTPSALFSGGQGEEIFRQLMDSAVGDLAVRQGRGIGIAGMILDRYGRSPEGGSARTFTA